MNSKRICGLALFALGLILVVIGTNASHSFADQLSNTFRGRFTDKTQWYIVGGMVSGLVGLSLLAFGSRGRDA